MTNFEQPDNAKPPASLEDELSQLVARASANAHKALRVQEAIAQQQSDKDLAVGFASLVSQVANIGSERETRLVAGCGEAESCLCAPENGTGSGVPADSSTLDQEAAVLLSFFGCLEGEPSHWPTPHIPPALLGGFMIRTPHGNILFDPGVGTLAGMRDMKIDLVKETDVIFVSNCDSTARGDLFGLLSAIAAAPSPETEPRPPLVCPKALYENGLSDWDRLAVEPRSLSPEAAWYLRRGPSGTVLEDAGQSPVPQSQALLIRTLPMVSGEAFDSGAAGPVGDPWLSPLAIETGEYRVIFTGTAGYSEEAWENVCLGEGGVDVLIANVHKLGNALSDGVPGKQPFRLDLRKDRMGFEGVCRLADRLKPKVLVLRAFGLECVVAQDPKSKGLRYAPEQLWSIQRAMSARLRDVKITGLSGRGIKVIVPGRLEIRLTSGEPELRTLMPVFPEWPTFEFSEKNNCFRTADWKLAREIRSYIQFLKNDERPFLVIEGETGGGKTQLAKAIAAELVKAKGLGDDFVRKFDLAAVGANQDTYGKILFGWGHKTFTNVKEHPGLLSTVGGVVILNQLEKLPIYESQRFLDVIEEWEYWRHGEEGGNAKSVEVTVIFTTNRAINQCDNLPPDLKNRLMTRRCSLPRLEDLSIEDRKRDLGVYVAYWCRDNGVSLAPEILGRLHELDLSNGSFRTLRGILEVSRFLAWNDLELANVRADVKNLYVQVTEEYFYEAMQRNQVGWRKAVKKATGQLPADLVCLVAIWISLDCTNNATYSLLEPGQGKSPDAFKSKLAEFRGYFASSDEAWEFFLGGDRANARLALSQATAPATGRHPNAFAAFDAYLEKIIGQLPQPGIVQLLFGPNTTPDWICECAASLSNTLFGLSIPGAGGGIRPGSNVVRKKFKDTLDDPKLKPSPQSP